MCFCMLFALRMSALLFSVLLGLLTASVGGGRERGAEDLHEEISSGKGGPDKSRTEGTIELSSAVLGTVVGPLCSTRGTSSLF